MLVGSSEDTGVHTPKGGVVRSLVKTSSVIEPQEIKSRQGCDRWTSIVV